MNSGQMDEWYDLAELIRLKNAVDNWMALGYFLKKKEWGSNRLGFNIRLLIA